MDSSANVLRAIINLQGNKDFEVVVQWLTDSREVYLKEASEIKEDVSLRWWQGKAQCLDALLRIITNARSLMEKIRH